MDKRKVIIDCDPGIDDAYAIAIALQEPSFDVLGIHTVSGNVSIKHTTRNAQGLTYLMNKQVPIHPGNREPLIFDPIFADDVHGSNGFAGYEFADEALNPVSQLDSLQAYVKVLTECQEKVTIIAIGPLTNLGILLKSYPQLKEKIECISIMGGGIKGGNITAAGEFNFYVDPHSADIVFRSGIPIIMAGLDVTEKARIHQEDIEDIKTKGGKLGEVLHTIAQPGLKRSYEEGNGYTTAPNDTVSVLALTNPELFTGKKMHIRVDYTNGYARGMSIADVRLRSLVKPNAYVLLDVNQAAFRKVLVEKVIGS